MSWWQSHITGTSQFDKSSVRFPVELQVIPDILSATIFLHDFILSGKEISCWTYLTSGLAKLSQKELIISIVKKQQDESYEFPQAPLEFFKTVAHHAMQSQHIDSCSVSEFGGEGFLSSCFKGSTYVPAQQLGSWFPPQGALAVILLTQEEIEISQRFGINRVLSLMGQKFLHFPCPVWNDLSRQSIVDSDNLVKMGKSFLTELPRMLVRHSNVSAVNRVIELELPLSARTFFKQLAGLGEDTPILLLTDLDQISDALLVWHEDTQAAPVAITAPGASGKRVSGSFICFGPGQEQDQGLIIEDGYAVSLKNDTWKSLKETLISGKPFYMSCSKEGYDLKLSWKQSANEQEVCEMTDANNLKFDIFENETSSSPELTMKVSIPAYAKRVELLTHEQELKNIISNDVLARYIEHLEDVVRDHFFCMGEQEGFDLDLHVCILPSKEARFLVSSKPIMEAEDESDLLDRLSLTYAPSINEGQIKFNILLSIWGGATN